MRRWLRVVCAAATLVALAGCVRLDMDLTVGMDDTLDGAIVIAFDSQALGPFVSADDLLEQVEKQNPLGRRPAHGSVEVEDYKADGMVGKRYRYTGVPLADVSEGPLKIRHSGRRYLLDGVLDLTAHGDSRVNIGVLTDTASAAVRLTFPGKVLASNGEIVGRGVTWRPTFGKKTTISAEADDGRPVVVPSVAVAGGGPGSSALVWVVAASVALLLLLGGLVVWWARSRGRAGVVGVAGAGAGAGVGDVGVGDAGAAGGAGAPPPRNPTLPLPVLESPDSLVRDPRWSEQASSDPWQSGQG